MGRIEIKLGELLIRSRAVDRSTVARALDLQEKRGGRLASNLVALGRLDPEKAVFTLCRQLRAYPALPKEFETIPRKILETIPPEIARRCRALPYKLENRVLSVAMVDPLDAEAARIVEFNARCSVEPHCAYELAVLDGLERFYGFSMENIYRRLVGESGSGQVF